MRVRLDDGSGFDLTEAGTQKKLAAYLVRDPADGAGRRAARPGRARRDARRVRRRAAGRGAGQLKGVIKDQEVLAGIGNAYSDEILHAAKLSPFAITDRLTEEQFDRLYAATREVLTGAVDRSVGQKAATSRARSAPASRCTPGPACRARSAATRSARCRTRTPASSTARAARPAASRWPTGGCPG